MGWYYVAEDWLSSFKKVVCPICKKKIKVGEQVYFLDFAKGTAEHFSCALKKSRDEMEEKMIPAISKACNEVFKDKL